MWSEKNKPVHDQNIVINRIIDYWYYLDINIKQDILELAKAEFFDDGNEDNWNKIIAKGKYVDEPDSITERYYEGFGYNYGGK